MNWLKRIYNKDKFTFLFTLTILLIGVSFVLALIFIPIIFDSYSVVFSKIKYYLFADMGQYFYFAVNDNPYVSEFSTIYFPLGIIIMKPFAIFSKNASIIALLENGNGEYKNPLLADDKSYRVIDIYNAELLKLPGFWVGIILYFAITLTLIGILTYKMFAWKSKKQFFFAYAVFCLTGPFVVGIIRGTNVFTVLLCVMLFLYFKDSRKAVLRELAFVFLAIAGVVRIYPFLFGAILLSEKRFLDSLKVGLYSLILIFVPFLFYEQPFVTMSAFFTNITSFVGSGGRLKDAMNLSIYSMFGYIFYLFGINNAIVLKVFGLTSTISAFCLSVSVAIFAKQKYIKYMAIVCGMVLVTPVAYYYVLIFLLIPIIEFMKEGDCVDPKRKKIYLSMFFFLCFLLTSVIGWYLVQSTALYALLIYEFCMLFKQHSKADMKNLINDNEQFSNSLKVNNG